MNFAMDSRRFTLSSKGSFFSYSKGLVSESFVFGNVTISNNLFTII